MIKLKKLINTLLAFIILPFKIIYLVPNLALIVFFAWFIVYSAPILAENLKTNTLTIFHLNDSHARAEENLKEMEKNIGFAKIATYIQQEKAGNPNVLVLDAGDTFHGSEYAYLSKGEFIIEILNALPLDAMSPGNHDFNYGYDRLKELQKKAKFKILAANVLDKNKKLLFDPSFYIYTFGDLKVGIFGLSTPEAAYKSHPDHVKDIEFSSIVKAAKDQIKVLKSQGVNFIIAVGHLGIDNSTLPQNRSTALVELKDIDLIIDGHSHSALPKGLIKNGILIAQTGEHLNNLGKVIVSFSDNYKNKEITAQLINKAQFKDIPADPQILSIIDKYRKTSQNINSDEIASDEKITYLNIPLEGDRKVVRVSESNLGLLIADAMKYYVLEDPVWKNLVKTTLQKTAKNNLRNASSNLDMAFINGGNIRTSLNPGEIFYKDIRGALPFESPLVVVSVTGKELMAILEHSVSAIPEPSGGFLHGAGLTFEVDIKVTHNRVKNVKVGGQPLASKKVYNVALPDFLVAGGDGYEMLKNKQLIYKGIGIEKIFADFLKTTPLVNYDFSPRIKIIK
ncbi:Bifunctional metallophosphatase/5'-nucleotidase [Candidatus Hepatincolaceae symbiont of Richtersius coronifer]